MLRLAGAQPLNHLPREVVPFEPHPLIRGGHAQTLASVFLPGHAYPYRARQHRVALDDGDQLILHDDCPPNWRLGRRTVMLVHGLAGSHQSSYMQRVAGRLCQFGVRVFRLDLRGAGAGALLARLPYHSGRSEDARAAVEAIAGLCPGSPTTVVGFSLGGNVVLKLLGELGSRPCGNLVNAIAVSPPIELETCALRIRQFENRLYDRHFVDLLLRQVRQRARRVPGAPTYNHPSKPASLYEFDDRFTAPVSGFGTAACYYRECSGARFVPAIRLPTLIISAADDPLIPAEMFERLQLPPEVSLRLTPGGGHLGFIARLGPDPDRRWIDWRIVQWVLN